MGQSVVLAKISPRTKQPMRPTAIPMMAPMAATSAMAPQRGNRRQAAQANAPIVPPMSAPPREEGGHRHAADHPGGGEHAVPGDLQTADLGDLGVNADLDYQRRKGT